MKIVKPSIGLSFVFLASAVADHNLPCSIGWGEDEDEEEEE